MTNRTLQKLVHIGCRDLGIDGETRRDLQLITTGKESMRDMSDADLERMVAALKARGFIPSVTLSKGRAARPAAPRADVRFCHVMWRLLAEKGAVKTPGRAGLNAFIRSQFEKKWGHVPLDIDGMREWREIFDVVEALKSWCLREGIDLLERSRE